MRIATWNLNRPGPLTASRAKALLEHIDKIKADIWILTETHKDFSPGEGYSCVALSSEERKDTPGEYWTAIWTRGEGEQIPLTNDPQRTTCARISIQGEHPIVVYGTVLPWLTDIDLPAFHGSAAFIERLQWQQREWQRLQREYADHDFCVAGDFNQDLAATHYYGSNDGRDALRAALASADLDCVIAGSRDPAAAYTEHKTIDHICLGPTLQALGTSASGTWPPADERGSKLIDHFGTFADIVSKRRLASQSAPSE